MVERLLTMSRDFFPNAVIFMGLAALAGTVVPASGADAQSSNPVMQMSPICSCDERPKNRLHAKQIVAACNAIALDNEQPTSRRLQAMKRQSTISKMVER